ncbi:MAG: nitrite reductase [Thermodesulfobacteriota bacterium]
MADGVNGSKSLEQIEQGLPDLVRDELNEFEENVKKFRAGKIGDVKFQKIRLQLGTYAQRQDGVQMQRIKIPYGGMTSEQLRRLSDVSDKYASGFMHLTTRQDVQLYYIKLEDVPNMMRELADAGITTREACGNTVRNVTASPITGASPTETFDVTPYAEAFKNFMLRNPICQNMGRKFKVCFESNQDIDNAGIMIHDLGFRAKITEIDGKKQKGFQLYVGGGLGASPSLGHLWSEFIPVEEMIPLSASIVRIFDRYGERKVRMKARMKFLIRKLGFDKFKELVDEERANLEVDPEWNNYLKNIPEHETPPDKKYNYKTVPKETENDPEYIDWKNTNISPAGEKGYSIANIRVKLGDVPSDTGRALADIADSYGDGNLRVTIQQNFVIRWIPDKAVPSLYNALKEIGLSNPGADSFRDITACPGADTCRLGITSAKGLATRLTDLMNNGLGKYKESSKNLKIKISGCPNSCAQHASANIGFQGASITKDGRSVPAEMLFLGGGLYGDDSRLATPIGKVPTRNAPKVVERLLAMYEAEKEDGEHFDLYMKKLGPKAIKDILKEYNEIPSYEDDPDFYKDWGHEEEEFGIQQGVKGECAGATVEEKIPTFADAEKRLEQAQALFIHGEYESSINELYLACSDSAHVPLYTKLVDPFTPDQTLWEFENLLVRTGEADKRWVDISKSFKDYRQGEYSAENAVKFLEIAKEFNAECQKIQSALTKD